MLLTLLKVTFFFGVVLAAALGAMYLSEHGAPLLIQFNGVEYTLGPVQAAIAAIVPAAAQDRGWSFRYPTLDAALRHELGKEQYLN